MGPARSWYPLPIRRRSGGERGASEKATFAGGCFWCMEPPFDELPGVISTTSGYTGGGQKNPTYEQVSAGGTGHAEAVEVVYDPSKITYASSSTCSGRTSIPSRRTGSSATSGHSIVRPSTITTRSRNDWQKRQRRRWRAPAVSRQPIVTEIAPASPFYRAEEYHQDYYKKNPIRFKFYRYRCGRAQRLEELWGSK